MTRPKPISWLDAWKLFLSSFQHDGADQISATTTNFLVNKNMRWVEGDNMIKQVVLHIEFNIKYPQRCHQVPAALKCFNEKVTLRPKVLHMVIYLWNQ